MIPKLPLAVIVVLVSTLVFGCHENQEGDANAYYNRPAKDNTTINQRDYKNVPDPDDFYKSPTGLQLVDTLESRYASDFITLKNLVNASHAKLYVCYISSEIGKALTKCEKREKPFIKNLCDTQHVTFVDFSDKLVKKLPGITFWPVDGHFNKDGAQIMADVISGLITSNNDYRTDITYPPSSIPALLGDDDPDVDKLVEEKKGLPYKLATNHQGLRMDRPVESPKKAQHILLMGDSEIYFAGVDNPETITGVLQHDFPDKTIINAARWGYTIDDELSQWQQRTKYTEPDIVVLQVDGASITNLYFSQKIRFHRAGGKEIFKPSPLEQKFYSANFK